MREQNEDMIAVESWTMQTSSTQPEHFFFDLHRTVLLLVADGMGGHQSGEVASCFVVEQLSALLQGHSDIPTVESIEHALQQTNRDIFDRIAENPSWRAMGSTIVGAVLGNDRARVFNVGDSRIYRGRDGLLDQLSHDDTPDLPNYDGSPSLKSGVITQALGGSPIYMTIQPHIREIALQADDIFLLCSDGLTDMVNLETMEQLIDMDLFASVQRLFENAMQAGGRDNISIILARVCLDRETF